MRGGERAADFFCEISTASLRAWRRSRPSAASREEAQPRAQPADARPGQRPQPVHDGEPGDPEGERQPGHPGGDHAAASRRGNSTPAASPLPTRAPTTPPALWRSAPGCQCRVVSAQLATSTSRKPAMRTAVLARELLSDADAPLHAPAGQPQHQREQERRAPEEEEEYVGEPGADHADAVVDRGGTAGEGETRVIGAVGAERHEQHDRHDADGNDRAFAQPAAHGRSKARAIARRRRGFSQPGRSPS